MKLLFIFNLHCSQFKIQHEQAVSLKKSYIVHLSQFPKSQVIAAGLTTNSVVLHDISSGKILETRAIKIDENAEHNVCGIKCSPQNDNELFVCSTKGEILLYDVRTNALETKFYDAENPLKPYTAFDLNCNGRILCAGTEAIKTDVFLNFFDVRQTKILGGYFESHEDDISQVKFHPTNPNLLLSGALDGLINVFDISESDEDDALQTTFNTDRSVSSLNWWVISERCPTFGMVYLYNNIMKDITATNRPSSITPLRST